MKPRVLVVDDEETIRKLLKSRLDRDGLEVTIASNADDAEKSLNTGSEVGVLVTDLKMPGRDGFQLMEVARTKNPNLQVIVITGHGEKEIAVKALRSGACDYLEKPFDLDELARAVKRGLWEYQLARENKELMARLEARAQRVEGKSEDQFWYVSKDPAMTKVNEWMNVLRRESLRGEAEEPTVLILGESGTGKEGIARMVHAGSRRARGPWVAVNCANFSEQLLESELFGHERGAFTGANSLKRGLFEIAKGGTLFLDEIGEMDTKLQAKLLRVLQEKVFRRVGATTDIETDVRVVAATHNNLVANIGTGKFREDLYHRINRVTVEVPSLCARKNDIVVMATQFAERAFRARGKAFSGFTPEAEQTMRDYAWPGNVRELLNTIERVSLLYEGTGPVSEKGLSLPQNQGQNFTRQNAGGHRLELVASPFQAPTDSGVVGYMDLKKKWSDQFEREYLVSSLGRHKGNVSAAAREAKLDRSNFLRLLRRHEIKAQEYRLVGSAPDLHEEALDQATDAGDESAAA